jgi:hypothetical protein
MAFYIDQAASRPALRRDELGLESHETNAFPALLFARRLVEIAFHDALQCGSDGRPTERALEAWAWLTDRLDWTLHRHKPPPEEIRSEFYGSFEWCCRWLGESPDQVRGAGLPDIRARVFIARQRPRDSIRGLPDIKRRWTISAARRTEARPTVASPAHENAALPPDVSVYEDRIKTCLARQP